MMSFSLSISTVNTDSFVSFLFLQQRLESLAKFQLSVLNHALSFPFVKRVVYSTCSVHQQVFVAVIVLRKESSIYMFKRFK